MMWNTTHPKGIKHHGLSQIQWIFSLFIIKLKFTIEITLTSNANSSRTHSTHDPTNFSKCLWLFYHEILPTNLVDFSVPLYTFAFDIQLISRLKGPLRESGFLIHDQSRLSWESIEGSLSIDRVNQEVCQDYENNFSLSQT